MQVAAALFWSVADPFLDILTTPFRNIELSDAHSPPVPCMETRLQRMRMDSIGQRSFGWPGPSLQDPFVKSHLLCLFTLVRAQVGRTLLAREKAGILVLHIRPRSMHAPPIGQLLSSHHMQDFGIARLPRERRRDNAQCPLEC